MATLTQITGHLYDAQGEVVSGGILYITLQQDMISVDGTKVAPFTINVDLAATAGYVDVSVYATVGATPAALAYKVEYDPDPADTSRPIRLKDGYWRNYWAVPNVASVSLGSFVSALRGAPSFNYMPVGGTISSFSDEVTLGTGGATNKRIIANQTGSPDPELRYNNTLSRWEFSDNGTTYQAFLQGGGGAVGGDLSGTVGAATVIKIRGTSVSATAPTITGQYLRYNSGTAQYEASLDGSQLTGLNGSNISSGTIPLARIVALTNAQIDAAAAIAWAKISKTGSSLADLATRNAADLTGTIPIGTITGLTNANIAAAAGIDATKLTDGTVTNTELQKINDLDQHLATTSTPQFTRAGFGGAADTSAVAKFFGQTCSPIVDNGSSGAAKTIDWNSGNVQKLTLTAACTLTLNNPKESRYVLILTQDGVGAHTVVWPGAVKWPSGNAPTLTNTPGARDVVVLIYDATAAQYLGAFTLNY